MAKTTTADWHGTIPESRSWTSKNKRWITRWGCRKVAPNGTVRFFGNRFRPQKNAVIQPTPGEWVLVYDYGSTYRASSRGIPVLNEWTAPADPDNYIRRAFWEHVPE